MKVRKFAIENHFFSRLAPYKNRFLCDEQTNKTETRNGGRRQKKKELTHKMFHDNFNTSEWKNFSPIRE